jgi:UDP-N-acetyl-D-glucosamine dehydrogenase
MRFSPGPGIGGHCIPLDPFYLTWKAREFGIATRFIELAGEINLSMPHYVVEKLRDALDRRGKPLRRSGILVLGLAYKKDIGDSRESPSFEIIELLLAHDAVVAYHDPFIPAAPAMRSWPSLPPLHSVPLTAGTLQACDAVIIATDHSAVDYELVAKMAPLVVDTRGVFRAPRDNVVKA